MQLEKREHEKTTIEYRAPASDPTGIAPYLAPRHPDDRAGTTRQTLTRPAHRVSRLLHLLADNQ
jgi:hypothetical protein